jgi:hypothetical protein
MDGWLAADEGALDIGGLLDNIGCATTKIHSHHTSVVTSMRGDDVCG